MDRPVPITPSAGSKPEIPAMPKYWKFGRGEGEGFSLSNLVLFIAVGKLTVKEFWESAYPGCPNFSDGRNEISKRLSHVNLVAGLLLTTIATFCTTDPPANSTLLPYTRNATYTLLVVSLALSLGGLIVGSTTVFIMARSNSYTVIDSRGRLVGMLIIWAYPFISVTISTFCLATALLISASRSDVHVLKYGGYPLLVLPMSCLFLFIWVAQGDAPPVPLPGDVEKGRGDDSAGHSHSQAGSIASLH